MAKVAMAPALLAVAVAAAGLLAAGPTPAQGKAAHHHMGHVLDAFKDTPDGAGLLGVAEAEAEIALRHAALAAERPGDITWMRRHLTGAVHALDPATAGTGQDAGKGPGKGYGLIRAAMGVRTHVMLAAGAADASAAVKLHADYVAASAANAARRGEKVLALARRVMGARLAGEAARAVNAIVELCGAILAGVDADGDGHVGGKGSEGGLKQARSHMIFMMRAEGLR